MRIYQILALVFTTQGAFAQPLDAHYLDTCKVSKRMLQVAEEKMNSSGGRKLEKASPIFEKSREECFTEPKDIKLSDEQVAATQGSDGAVGPLRVGLARSNLASEKMKGRVDRCLKDRKEVLDALEEDFEEKGRLVSAHRDSIKAYQEEAARRNIPPAQQAPTLDAMKLQLREAEEDTYKAGTAKYSMRDAYDTMSGCYSRTQVIYNKAAAEYERALSMTAAQSVEMASEGPQESPKLSEPPTAPKRELTSEDVATQAQDKTKEWLTEKAIQKPIEKAITVAGTTAAGLSKRLVNPIAGAVADIVIPSANPGGACAGAPVSDPWKRYNAGCFGVQSVGSAISILKRP